MSTSVSLGSGEFTYVPQEDWAQLPDGWSFHECADVAVDANDRVYVFNRGDHPVIMFEADGTFVGSWGEGVFTTAHGITYAPNDTMYLADQKDHSVRRCTLDGRVVSTIGQPHHPPTRWSGLAFNEPTKVAVSPPGTETCSSPTATATHGSTSTAPTADTCSHGARRASTRASSSSPTRSWSITTTTS